MTRLWAVTLLLIASPVLAQNRPCREEVEKFCLNVTPGRGALVNCLKPHQAELSSRCKRALARMQRRREGVTLRRRQIATARSTTRTPAAPTTASPTPSTPTPPTATTS